MKAQSFQLVCLVLLSMAVGSACSISRMASDITSDIMVGGAPVFEQESDPAVAESSGLAMLKTLEVFSYHNPKNDEYKVLLAKNYGNYAFGFLENKLLRYENVDPENYNTVLARAQLFYTRGRDYGLTVLKKDGRFDKALNADQESFEKAVAKISRNKMEALFWTAFAWGGLINLNRDDPTAIIEMGRVESMMGRAAEINNTYFYGGPHLFYGVYYGSRPAMLGGNLEKSKENFEKAISLTEGRFLFAKVLYAQFYAVQAQDQALYNQLLQEALSADANALPEQQLANVLAQQRAHTLLGRVGEFF